MRSIFAGEITFNGPSDEELDWVGAQLFANVSVFSDFKVRKRVLLLRTLRAITQIQRIAHPDVAWTDWTRTERLVEATANVLAELEFGELNTVASAAERSVEDARDGKYLQFEERDEWHPGIVSGAGWVERASLSHIGNKYLAKMDALSVAPPSPPKIDDDDIPF
jgi:hypothetical protein